MIRIKFAYLLTHVNDLAPFALKRESTFERQL